MRSQATGTFAIKSWDEKPHDTLSGDIKLTRATVVQSFTGDIEGDGKVEYLMVYREDGTASFIGLQLVSGRIGDRYGSFVLQNDGEFEAGTAKAAWTIVPGSGTGGLRGLTGSGGFEATHDGEATFTLDYTL